MEPIDGRPFSPAFVGSILKLVACEKCGREYVYRLERNSMQAQVSGQFLNNPAAHNQWRPDLAMQAVLEADCDPVPCPQCGWYQAPMAAKLRNRFQMGRSILALVLLVGGLILAGSGHFYNQASDEPQPLLVWTFVVVGLLGVLAGLVLLLARAVAASRYDPNAPEGAAERAELGKARELPREQFERARSAERRQRD